MNHTQIKKATDILLVNRYKWLVNRLDKITPVLSAHDNGTGKIENHHHLNKMRREQNLIYTEMESIEAEFTVRREAQKNVKIPPEMDKIF